MSTINGRALEAPSCKELLGLDGTVTAAAKLDGTVIAAPKSVVDLPMDHSLTKIDNKIIINSRTPELENASTKMIVLDVSSLKGGAWMD
ncbi:guanylate kinase 2-like [Pyrus ussuriensis x Pyrus communis]|uniref:Guanylate kinase 2-like n=1 Tax=Pyrus ussuriensis x Pyrus communis TaxID=2448454 RepID=A0A5N5FYJ6_9ROSA|nr:guanylate kinase 2-like [Pyrus ussuriensis x Pyrus communis]